MTQTQIQKMKNTRALILTGWQTFWHYSAISFFSFAFIMMAIADSEFVLLYIWILPAVIFYFIQKKRLKFRTIEISVDNITFHNAVSQAAKELDWDIEQMTDDIVVAKRGFSWRSWGEQITILHDKNIILFNSICDPNKGPCITTLGMNKMNRKTFEKLLRQERA